MSADNGGPAFPRDHRYDGHDGMTLRDWFAGQADVADIQFPDIKTAADWIGCDVSESTSFADGLEFSFKLEAAIRYAKADAMLAARRT